MANLNDYFGCFRLNLKIPVFQWYKRFFKAALCPGWNVAVSFPASLICEKGREYWYFLTNFSHELEHHSWYRRHLCLHKSACKKKIMRFVSQHGIFISIIPSKSALLFHDAHFFSFRKCYLDTIGKFKLGQQLGRYVVLSFARKFCVLYFICCPKYSIFAQDMP